jgi:hypothetical protein
MTASGHARPLEMPARSMLQVAERIGVETQALTRHPFLKRLEGPGRVDEFRRLLPEQAFFTLAFQDMLRLVRERSVDARAVAVAKALEDDDRGHEQWYLQDLGQLAMAVDRDFLFSAAQRCARDVSYAILGRIVAAASDAGRLAVALSLEAIAEQFFARVSAFSARLGLGQGLRYYGTPHLDAERSHGLYQDVGRDGLASLPVSDRDWDEALESIRVTFAAMTSFADHLDRAMGGPTGA